MDLTKQIRKSSYQNMTSDEYRHFLQKHTIDYLENEKKCKFLQYLGSGSYGDVISVISPNYATAVALKIVSSDDVWVGEIFLWPKLDHPNLLPLLETIELPSVYLFITPLMYTDLESMLEENYFLSNPSALKLVKRWLRDVLAALDYLHEQKLCHLDVKADNVLLDRNLKVMLCDFSFITGTSTFVGRYGVPMPYRPPDTCLTYEKDIPVDGMKFEMWTYGILALNMLTGHILKRKIFKEIKNWHRDIYPLIFEAMQTHNFSSLMSNAFPSSEITEEDLENALNFLHFLLRFEPKDRPSARSCADHIFLMRGRNVILTPDVYWIYQDLSDCKCPCLTEIKTPEEQIKKKFPRYKFKKLSPRIGGKIYKKIKKWTKQARDTELVKLTIVSESGDAGNSLDKNEDDCQVGALQLEEKDLTVESNKDQNSNECNMQKMFQVSTAVDSKSSEFVEQSGGERVKVDPSNQNEIEENERKSGHFNEIVSSVKTNFELSPKKVTSTCEAPETILSIDNELSPKYNLDMKARRACKKKYFSESCTWIRNLWASLRIYCKRRTTKS